MLRVSKQETNSYYTYFYLADPGSFVPPKDNEMSLIIVSTVQVKFQKN